MNPILLNHAFSPAAAVGSFTAINPGSGAPMAGDYPVSAWSDLDAALTAAVAAHDAMLRLPRAVCADFLDAYAAKIEAQAEALAKVAHEETGLPFTPRLKDVEIPRTVNQLRQAAAAARSGDWAQPVIDSKINLRACLGSIGPVAVFGPNNFPFAYNGIAGGDFASAMAAGNPVIAKAHPSHPGTSLALAKLALEAAKETGLPAGSVQLLYQFSHEDGLRLMRDPRLAALGFTGSRKAGLALKAACDGAGKMAYLEMSSVNPVVILPGALQERGAEIAVEYATSALMAAGQFCTNPGMVFTLAGAEAQQFLDEAAAKFNAATPGTLLNAGVQDGLTAGVKAWSAAGAQLLCGGAAEAGPRCAFQNTLLTASGAQFLANPQGLQQEAFGNVQLVITCADQAELLACLTHLEGNLTGGVYSAKDGADDAAYAQIAPVLRQKVGRLLNDKMPTGVAVSAAMNHGGPYPAAWHPGFSAVGMPGSLRRFAQLQSYDAVRENRLPDLLQDANPTGAWRSVDGEWTKNPL